jgi:hypothetical protein
MALLTRPSNAARTAVVYITAGALIVVWTVIWLWWLSQHPSDNDATYFWAYGCLLSGLTLLVIGFFLGRIGRAARHAELPPPEATPPTNANPPAAGTPVLVPLPPGAVPVQPGAAVPAPQATPVAAAPVAPVAPPATPVRR